MIKFSAVVTAVLLYSSVWAGCLNPADFLIPLRVQNLIQSTDGKACTYVNPELQILGRWMKVVPPPFVPGDSSMIHNSDSASGLCSLLQQSFVSFNEQFSTHSAPTSKGVWLNFNGDLGGTDLVADNFSSSVTCAN